MTSQAPDSAITRMRKTFLYPTDDDPSVPNDGLDEEEQDKVISAIARTDAAQTVIYRRIILAVSFLTLILLGVRFLHSTTNRVSGPLAALCTLSLLLSVLTTYDIPTTSSTTRPPTRHITTTDNPQWKAYTNLLRQHAILLNAATLALLTLLTSTSTNPTPPWQILTPPLLIFTLTAAARHELRPVDVGQLEQLRYDYKGA